MNTRFHSNSGGGKPGLTIGDVYQDEGPYLKIDKVNPGSQYPLHVSGKYGPLGWI